MLISVGIILATVIVTELAWEAFSGRNWFMSLYRLLWFSSGVIALYLVILLTG